MTDDDPLDGADIGQTETVERTVELHAWNVAPDVYFGSDRDSDVEVVDAELVADDGNERVAVTFEGDVTKYLAPRWDRSNQPRTEEERRKERRKAWLKRAGRVAAFVIPFSLSGVVAVHVTNELAGAMTVNGESLWPVTSDVYVTVALVVILAALIMYGLTGGLPGKVGGRR